MRRIRLLAALMVVLFLCGCGPQQGEIPAAPEVPPQTESLEQETAGILTAFTAEDLDCNAVDQSVLQDYALTMINVWATYCGPCIQEMPDLGKLAADYADRGLQVIGLVSDVLNADGQADADQLSLAKDIAAQTGATYLHLVPGSGMQDLMYQITAVPTTFFVDANGVQVGGTYVGARSYEDWSEVIEKVLGENG